MSGNQPRRRAMLGLLGAVPLAGGVFAALPTVLPPANAKGERIPDGLRPGGEFDRYVEQLAAEDKFSGSVMVAHRGEVVLARAHGMANKAKEIPNRTETIHNLASASKPFTGLAIVQLAQARGLDFHQTVGHYLDGFAPQIADTVTVHQLLTHTSGFGDFQTDPEYQENAEAGWTSETAMMDGIMAAIRRERLRFTPGTKTVYSSSGIALLGAIVEAVSGKSYYDYVRDHIFEPAGMSRTDFHPRPMWLEDPRFAHPYWFDENGKAFDGLRHRPPPSQTGHAGLTPYVGNPGGGGFSSAVDLVRFERALRNGSLLDPDYLELLFGLKQPGTPSEGTQVYGTAYVLTATLHNHEWIVGHGGGMYAGVSTSWNIYRTLDWIAIVLSNYANDTGIGPITDKVRRLITEQPIRGGRS